MTEDFYDLLEIPPDASQDDVKEAFREQVRVYHPDLNDDDRARAQFTALKKAYDILGDPVERRAYDRLGHEDYVAKRTSGLPSPDVWKSSSSSRSSASAGSATSTSGATTGSAGSTTSGAGSTAGRTGRSTGTASKSKSKSKARASASTAAGSAGSSNTAGAGTARSSATGTTTGGGSTTGGRSAAAGGGSTAGRTVPRSDRLTDNALVRWWQSRNFAGPLIWLSALTYLAGLVHFGYENRAPLEGLAAEASAIGGEPAALWELLTTGRHGVETTVGFVAGLELLEPPLPAEQWYGALAGLVVLSLVLVFAIRLFWRRDTWGPVSIDETIVVALALAAATMVVGGPLLAGIALMPLLFGVIVYRTKQLPRWSPSYAYVCCVLAPGLAFAGAAAGYETLLTDLLAFAVVPVLGAIGLPLRVTVRKRFGR